MKRKRKLPTIKYRAYRHIREDRAGRQTPSERRLLAAVNEGRVIVVPDSRPGTHTYTWTDRYGNNWRESV